MNQKELKELIDFLIERDITEFELERGDVKVRVKRASDAHAATGTHYMAAVSSGPHAPPTHVAVPSATTPPVTEPARPEKEEELHTVKSPIVGTFYESPAPGAAPFVTVGDSIQTGQVLCIIEAMKLMNEIEADISGEVVKRLVANGQPVEYGQPLFAIRPVK